MSSTKEKLIAHVSTEQAVGCTNKVTVVGVGMVGMAAAISILLKVRERHWFYTCRAVVINHVPGDISS